MSYEREGRNERSAKIFNKSPKTSSSCRISDNANCYCAKTTAIQFPLCTLFFSSLVSFAFFPRIFFLSLLIPVSLFFLSVSRSNLSFLFLYFTGKKIVHLLSLPPFFVSLLFAIKWTKLIVVSLLRYQFSFCPHNVFFSMYLSIIDLYTLIFSVVVSFFLKRHTSVVFYYQSFF